MKLAIERFKSLRLTTLLSLALTLLGIKILTAILAEYRYYFPANFEAAFLVGREATFNGLYRFAFYTHIIAGPICLLLATFLIVSGPRLNSGRRPHGRKMHRYVGHALSFLVFALLLPSGLVMSTQALAGPIAAMGFIALTLATAVAMAATIVTAIHGRLVSHRRWSIRCFLLLTSPLLLRFVAGLLLVADWESDLTYRLNAWLSWLLPLFVHEIGFRRRNFRDWFPNKRSSTANVASTDRTIQSPAVSLKQAIS